MLTGFQIELIEQEGSAISTEGTDSSIESEDSNNPDALKDLFGGL
jgi:hypothetical protein